jgi:hypothetical protein
MKAMFLVSLVCVFQSLVALIGISAITIAPGPGDDNERSLMMSAAGVCLVAWSLLALWARSRLEAPSASWPRPWLRRLLVVIGVIYALLVLLLTGG